MTEPGRQSLRWRTPEGFAFELPLAPVTRRAIALLLDLVIVGVALQILALLLRALLPGLPAFSAVVQTLVSAAAPFLYAAALEYFWQGRTLGKHALSLRVVDAHGLPLGGGQVMLRNLLRTIDIFPGLYLVGGLACLASRRAQRLGDMVAGTAVVMAAEAPAPVPGRFLEQRYNSLATHPAPALRLRQSITPEEAALALGALQRRDELAPDARTALYSDLANHLQRRFPFPAAAVETLSPEQYLRDAVALVFAPRF